MVLNFVVFLLFALEAGYHIYGQINTNSATCPTFASNKTQCNTDNTLPGIGPLSMTVLNNFQTLDKTALCGEENQRKFKTAARCLFDSYKHCGDNDFKGLVTAISKFEDAVDFVCSRSDIVDHYYGCMGDSIANCIRNKEARAKVASSDVPSRDEQFTEFVEYYCRKREIEEECVVIDEDIKDCASPNAVTTYIELRRLLKPPACSTSGLVASLIVMLSSLCFTIVSHA